MTTPDADQAASRLEALAFTDLADSTSLKSRIGLDAYLRALARHNALFEQALSLAPGASVVKHTGDGFFVRFPTPSAGANALVEFQRLLAAEPWHHEPLRARAGLHCGEVAVVQQNDQTDIVGTPADLAARIMSLAAPGQILCSATAADEARRTLSHLRWTHHGHFPLKGSAAPVDIWELADPAVTPLPPPQPAPTTFTPTDARRVGRYTLLEPVGEGGMGVVYKAEQRSPVRRIVALKLIKAGMDTRAVLARFDAERQALALMDHPNIAKVLDAGADEHGHPFFVMEFVTGLPLTTYADQRKLDVPTRLDLFAQVCDAVHHAHQKGIIHRDLKPSNILVADVDGKPCPKVIDFGVAKATARRLTDATLFTEQGQLIGTPEYMSPEQADFSSLDVDTRSDVYSFGVILYELLAGALPFDPKSLRAAALAEIQRILRDDDPPNPSTRLSGLTLADGTAIASRRQLTLPALASELRRELEWVPLKALSKDRDERYRSASELADDIRNYLAGRPLIAGPVSVAYRMKKYLRRHRGPAIASLMIGTATIFGIAGTAWQAIKATQAREVAVAAQSQSLNNFRRARQAFVALFDQPVTGESSDRVEAIRTQAVSAYESFVQESNHDPVVLEEFAGLLYRISKVQAEQRDFGGAVDTLARRCELLEDCCRRTGSTVTARLQLADALAELGITLVDLDANFSAGVSSKVRGVEGRISWLEDYPPRGTSPKAWLAVQRKAGLTFLRRGLQLNEAILASGRADNNLADHLINVVVRASQLRMPEAESIQFFRELDGIIDRQIAAEPRAPEWRVAKINLASSMAIGSNAQLISVARLREVAESAAKFASKTETNASLSYAQARLLYVTATKSDLRDERVGRDISLALGILRPLIAFSPASTRPNPFDWDGDPGSDLTTKCVTLFAQVAAVALTRDIEIGASDEGAAMGELAVREIGSFEGGPAGPTIRALRIALGDCYAATGRPEAAIGAYETVTKQVRRRLYSEGGFLGSREGQDRIQLDTATQRLIRLLCAAGRTGDAKKEAQEGVTVWATALKLDPYADDYSWHVVSLFRSALCEHLSHHESLVDENVQRGQLAFVSLMEENPTEALKTAWRLTTQAGDTTSEDEQQLWDRWAMWCLHHLAETGLFHSDEFAQAFVSSRLSHNDEFRQLSKSCDAAVVSLGVKAGTHVEISDRPLLIYAMHAAREIEVTGTVTIARPFLELV